MRYWATISAALLLTLAASAQTWEASKRIPGAFFNPHCWFKPEQHPTLIHFRVFPPGGPENFRNVYELNSVTVDSEPYGDTHGLRSTIGVGDVNGNGDVDILGPVNTSGRPSILLDAYTDKEVIVRHGFAGYDPGGWHDRGSLADLDGDGYNDLFNKVDHQDFAVISYGEAISPFGRQSIVVVEEEGQQFVDALCFGVLDGKVCMLRAVAVDNISGAKLEYQLSELNLTDILDRRDTVRHTTLFRYRAPDNQWHYRDVVFDFGDQWVMTDYINWRTCLRVSAEGIEEFEPHGSFKRSDGGVITGGTLYGQGRASRDRFTRVDGQKPFVTWFAVTNSLLDTVYDISIPDLYWISDETTMETQHLGTMNVADGRVGHRSAGAASVVPDLDGDGIMDVLLMYDATDWSTNQKITLTDLYLTGDRPVVSVAPELEMGPVNPCTFTNAPAFIYNVLGEVVANVDIIDDRIAPHQLEALPRQPLWVVQGECARPVHGACPRRESTGTW